MKLFSTLILAVCLFEKSLVVAKDEEINPHRDAIPSEQPVQPLLIPTIVNKRRLQTVAPHLHHPTPPPQVDGGYATPHPQPAEGHEWTPHTVEPHMSGAPHPLSTHPFQSGAPHQMDAPINMAPHIQHPTPVPGAPVPAPAEGHSWSPHTDPPHMSGAPHPNNSNQPHHTYHPKDGQQFSHHPAAPSMHHNPPHMAHPTDPNAPHYIAVHTQSPLQANNPAGSTLAVTAYILVGIAVFSIIGYVVMKKVSRRGTEVEMVSTPRSLRSPRGDVMWDLSLSPHSPSNEPQLSPTLDDPPHGGYSDEVPDQGEFT